MVFFAESCTSTRVSSPPRLGPTVALIPAFNEERFIGSIVLGTRMYVDQVIVVDDGSTDQTADIARRAGATVIQHLENQGKTAAVNTGFAYARRMQPCAVVMLDGDGQHAPDDIPALLHPIEEGASDIVIGSRFLSVRSEIPAYRKVGQHGLTLMTNLASGVSLTDSQSGFRAFSVAALQHLWFSQDGFAVESEMQFLVREHRLSLTEVPIKVTYADPAKRNPVRHGVQVVNGIMRLVGQLRPLLFFGLSGLMTLMLGFSLGIHVINIYAATLQLAVGYALLTVLLCVVGIVLSFAGIILHSMRGMMIEMRRNLVERLAEPGDSTRYAVVPAEVSTSAYADLIVHPA